MRSENVTLRQVGRVGAGNHLLGTICVGALAISLGWAGIRGGPRVHEWGPIPLTFEQNRGQAPEDWRFLARGPGAAILIRNSGMEIQLRPAASGTTSEAALPETLSRVRLQFEGANPQARVAGLEAREGKVHYYLGSDPANWLVSIPTFARVRVQELYPGIDLLYYGNQGKLEFDLVLEPGAHPELIRISVAGASLRLTQKGELALAIGNREIRLHRPRVHQLRNGRRIEIEGRYRLRGETVAGFQLGDFDPSSEVVIDPVVDFASYLGGSGFESANGIAVDAQGAAVVTGETRSTDFPLESALVGSAPGGFSDAFVTRFNPAGDGVVYSTYLGGAGDDIGYAVAVDGQGNAYVTGSAEPGFPISQGSLQITGSGRDVFIAKLSPSGTLVYSAVLGGNQPDWGRGIDVDLGGNAFVAGRTGSSDFPVTEGALQPLRGGSHDAFAAQLDADGTTLSYATFLGGGGGDEAHGIAVDSQGSAWVVGETNSGDATPFPTTAGATQPLYGGGLEDGFVAKIDASGSQLAFSSYLGGSSSDRCLAVDVDPGGSAVATGETTSSDFPLENARDDVRGSRDAFVTKFDAGGSLTFSSFFGGSSSEEGRGIAVNSEGIIYLTGETTSADFPEVDPLTEGQTNDLRNAFVAVLSADGSDLLFSSGFGGDEDDGANGIALDAEGNVYLVGATESEDLEVNGFQGNLRGTQDAFIAKIGGLVTQIRRLYFAQFGDGEAGPGLAISSLVTLYNLSSTSTAKVAVQIDGDDGSPLTVDLNGQQVPGVLDGLVIPPDGSISLETDGAGALQAGSVTVSSDQEVAGVILFRGFGVAGVGSSERLQRLRAPITVGPGLDSGLALMNLGAAQTIQLQLRDGDGTPVASASVPLKARGHVSEFVTRFDWDTPPDFSDFSGTVTATGESDFAATVILVTEAEFATLPVTRLIR